ncbi:hypothetical protein Gotri_025230 [Gossypium trilobum]|uniref:RNase H type-1 domain-containing protein n=1 Tax=Gossypium trilobum TaxID=34281 RepID=A0A7J9FRJ8_9ROSI|nr:hypothetical protein [Gossypium trilobum]
MVVGHRAISFPFTAKAQTCVQALRLGIRMEIECVIIEGDSLAIIKKLAKENLEKGEDLYMSGGAPDFVHRKEERRRQQIEFREGETFSSGVSHKEDSNEASGTLFQLRYVNPNVVFLIETKLQGANMERVRCKCGFQHGIDVNSDGRRVVYQRDGILIDLDGKTLRCTGFYGAPKQNMKEASWNLLWALNDCPQIPWLVIGDFNKIVYSSERKGGLPRRERQMGSVETFLKIDFFHFKTKIESPPILFIWCDWITSEFNHFNKMDRFTKMIIFGLQNPGNEFGSRLRMRKD